MGGGRVPPVPHRSTPVNYSDLSVLSMSILLWICKTNGWGVSGWGELHPSFLCGIFELCLTLPSPLRNFDNAANTQLRFTRRSSSTPSRSPASTRSKNNSSSWSLCGNLSPARCTCPARPPKPCEICERCESADLTLSAR